MPYIKDEERRWIDTGTPPKTAGQLTYKFYKTALIYLGRDWTFARLAVVIGCLMCTVLELYRRQGAPHEDKKLKKEGDI